MSCYCFIIVAAVIVLWPGGIVSVVCSIVLSKGSSCYCFVARGIVSVVCSIVLL